MYEKCLDNITFMGLPNVTMLADDKGSYKAYGMLKTILLFPVQKQWDLFKSLQLSLCAALENAGIYIAYTCIFVFLVVQIFEHCMI